MVFADAIRNASLVEAGTHTVALLVVRISVRSRLSITLEMQHKI